MNRIRKMQTAAGGPLKKPKIKLNGLWRELNYEGNGDFSTLTENGKMSFTTGQKSPKSIVGNKEIVVTPEQTTVLDKLDNTKNYYSAHNPEDVINFFNIMTLGGINRVSPVQNGRALYNLGKFVYSKISGKPGMTWSGFTNSLINGNNGLVSQKFSEEHPYLSAGANIIGDTLPIALATTPLNAINKVELIGKITVPGFIGGVGGIYVGDKLDEYLPKKYKNLGKSIGYGVGAALGAKLGLSRGINNPLLLRTKYTKLNDVVNNPLTTTAATIQGKYPWTRRQDIRLKRLLFDDIEEAKIWLNNSGYDRMYLPEVRILKKDLYYSDAIGKYSPYYNKVTVLPTFNKYSNLPLETNSNKLMTFKGVVNHELTHGRLNYFGGYSEYDPESGYWIARKDLDMESLNPFKLKKNGSWSASPDEFDSELSNLLITTGKSAFEPVDNISPLTRRLSISKQAARNFEKDILNNRKSLEFFKLGGILQFLQKGKPIKVPKKRTVIKTIKLNNGVLTAELDKDKNVYWFRNNKYLTPDLVKNYKFYDPEIKGYRLLSNYYSDLINSKINGTKVYTPNLDYIRNKDLEIGKERMDKNQALHVPFGGDKITLRTKGRMNLADVPVALLDSIAINSGRSNTDFWTNAALIGKESTFGGYSKALGAPAFDETVETPRNLVNNHMYFQNDYGAYNNALLKNGRFATDSEGMLRDDNNVKYALDHGLIEGKVPHYSDYVLADAFKRYALNPDKYNPGQNNYVSMVNNIKLELMKEKLLLNYHNTRGKEFYNKGKNETMKKGGIIKAQFGTDLNVDNLSDTTRKGYGKLPYFGAANNSNTAGLLDLLNYNVTNNPNIITGAPEILPGRVGMMEKEAPTIYKMIVENGENIKNTYHGIWNGNNWKSVYDTLRDFFKTGSRNILTLLENWAKENEDIFIRRSMPESIPKGFTKGNEIPLGKGETVSEAGLSVRNTKIGDMSNPPTNPSEKFAVEDWNKMNPDDKISSLLSTGRPSYELELDGLKIDIRYPKLAQPLLKKLNSPILKIEQRAPKKTAKERYLERKEIPSKNIRKKDSYNLSYEDGDVRHVNSGNRRITAAQDKEDWDALGKYSTFSKKHHNIELRLSKYDKGTPAYKLAWKERKALILEYREKFRFRLKRGGIIKAQAGIEVPNPNATGGVFLEWLNYLLKLPLILKQQQEYELRKKELEILKSLQKYDMMLSLLGTAIGTFRDYVANNLKLPNTKKTDNGTPSKNVTVNGLTINRENLGVYGLFMT